MKIEFFGATQGVTGSKHLLHINGKKILLECGLFQGRRKESIERNMKFPFNPADIDMMVLSHAHIDHSGAIPALVKNGFEGPIFCTHATRDLCSIMLKDSAYIQEKDTEWIRKKLKDPDVEPLYTIEDAEKAITQFRSVSYGQKLPITSGVSMRFFDAGHVLGSAVEEWDIFDNETQQHVRLGFTGDLGRHDLPILHDPFQMENLNVLITESTYGNRMHDEIESVEDHLAEKINQTVERGGKILIPAFAVERTQEILYVLRELIMEKKIPALPTFIDSPLATRATEIFRIHPECFDKELNSMMKHGKDPFSEEHNVQFTRSVDESKALNNFSGSAIIISASGMCEAGRIRHHLINQISDPRNMLMVVGFMAANTLGRKLVDGESPVNIFGDPYDVKAEVVIYNAFSGHADQQDLLRYVRHCGNPKTVFCVHGEEEQIKVYREEILKLPNCKDTEVFIPHFTSSYVLGEGGRLSESQIRKI